MDGLVSNNDDTPCVITSYEDSVLRKIFNTDGEILLEPQCLCLLYIHNQMNSQSANTHFTRTQIFMFGVPYGGWNGNPNCLVNDVAETVSYHTKYRKISNINNTKSQNLNASLLGLQLPLRNILKPSIKWRMKMKLEQRLQAMLQLYLSDQQFNCLLNCILCFDSICPDGICDTGIWLSRERVIHFNAWQ